MNFEKIKLFLIDLDGTTYLDNNLIDGVVETLDEIKKQGKNFCFVSNNSSLSKSEYLKKFKKLGLKILNNELITSSEQMVSYLKEKKLHNSVYLLGTNSLVKEFKKVGVVLKNSAKTVVLAYDKELTYKKLTNASTLISNGANYFATHLDKVCPSTDKILPDVGSFIKLIFEATGKNPAVIGGKPTKEFGKFILSKYNFKPSEICFIGDRLYTDILFAKNNKFKSILVLTGETHKEDLEKSDIKPDLILNTISDLKNLI